jgi:hypothetical protein
MHVRYKASTCTLCGTVTHQQSGLGKEEEQQELDEESQIDGRCCPWDCPWSCWFPVGLPCIPEAPVLGILTQAQCVLGSYLLNA